MAKKKKALKERDWPLGMSLRLNGIESDLDSIRRYLDTVTAALNREFTSYEKHLSKLAKGAPDHVLESLAEDFSEAKDTYLERFPGFAFETCFVSSYSILEAEMLQFAKAIGSFLNVSLSLRDLRDSGIRGARKYLQTQCGVVIPDDSDWKRAIAYSELRNVIVHNRGRVRADNNSVRNFVKASKRLLILDHYDNVKLTKDFCEVALTNIYASLKKAYDLGKNRLSIVS